MPDHPSDKIWDEYDWERFLQQQEQRTERYMELLEKYIDHPQRDELIAREMGWTHLLSGESRDWEDEVDADFEKEHSPDSDDAAAQQDLTFSFERHPLYAQTVALGADLDEIFRAMPVAAQEHPAAVTIRSQATLAAAKLAAALNDDDVDELGMSIAYLKRALHALTISLEAALQLQSHQLLGQAQFERVRDRLFEIRNGIVTSMGELRAEFRRRYHR